MGFRLVAALAVSALLVLAWQGLRQRPWQGHPCATAALLLAPGLLLLAADGYALVLLARGCVVTPAAAPAGPFATAGLAGLAIANAALIAGVLRAGWHRRRTARLVAALPRLDAATSQRLTRALPALSGVALHVCPGDSPVLFTTGDARRAAIVMSSWTLSHLDPAELVGAIAHELGHITHGDGRLLHWVHALCPRGLGLFRRELAALGAALEARADAYAAASTADGLAVASALVKVSRFSLTRTPAALAFADGGSGVQARVQRLLDGPAPAARLSLRQGWPLLALGLATLYLALQAVGSLCGVHAG